MNKKRDRRLFLGSLALLGALFVSESRALDEALSLSINSAPAGSTTTATVAILNPADVESLSLELSFASGATLTLPASNWFNRGDYFPSTPFGPSPSVELNHYADGSGRTRIYIDGFGPSGTSGEIGSITFNVAAGAGDEDSQVLSLSGKFWSRAEQMVKTFLPVSEEFTIGESDDRDGDGVLDTEDAFPDDPTEWEDTDSDGIGNNADPDDDNDGVPDETDSRPLDPHYLGSELAMLSLNHTWSEVTSLSSFDLPVVIVGPPTAHGGQPGVVRVDNVSGTGFELSFQEWRYLDGSHAGEDIPYLVLEEGRHTMADGSFWEVGTFPLWGTGEWMAQSFTAPFPGTPRLFLTAQSANGGQPVSVRAWQVSPSGFQAALYEEQALMDGHTLEMVGYLAIYSPHGGGTVNLGGATVPYLLQQVGLDDRWTPVLSHTLRLEEEQSWDAETAHVEETVDILAVGGQLFAQLTSLRGGDPVALRRHAPEYNALMEWGVVDGITEDWTAVPLAKHYTQPVVIAKPVSGRGSHPGVIRLNGITGNAFQLRYQEWNYLDGKHAPEQVFYLVAEAGVHNLGGLTVEAGTRHSSALARAGRWEAIPFSAGFSQAPAVLSAVQSYSGSHAVTTRIGNLDALGFDLAMDEQEDKADGHTVETLGWIALSLGTGLTNDRRRVQVLSDAVNHRPTFVPFGLTLERRYPVVVSDTNSAVELDPVFLRYRNPTANGIELYLQEEQSADAEMSHALEEVGVFVAE